MSWIPQAILQRIIWNADGTIQSILPGHPCDYCGAILDQPQISKINRNTNPYPHWREQCKNCKRLREYPHDIWFDTPKDINIAQQSKEYLKKTGKIHKDDK